MRDKAKNSAVKKSYEKRVSCWTEGLEISLKEPVIEQIIAKRKYSVIITSKMRANKDSDCVQIWSDLQKNLKF